MSFDKLIDYKSTEKDILIEILNSIPFMDKWIANIVENYIYSSEREYYIIESEQKGTLKCEYRTRYGIKDGKYKEWWFDTKWGSGQLRVQTTYLGGKIHGEYRCWYNNGQIYEHTTYVNGKRHGEYKYWHGNGQMKKKATYVDGKIQGEYKQWFYVNDVNNVNNNLLIEHTFVDDVLHGEYKEWFDTNSGNSQLRVQTTYVKGKLHGDYKMWRYTGELQEQIVFVNGVRV
jgi:antitoxin component YwqK of YwqJK toxin-antitoxin module